MEQSERGREREEGRAGREWGRSCRALQSVARSLVYTKYSRKLLEISEWMTNPLCAGHDGRC